MTVLAITGIGGFIGLRMCERALALGWTVRGLDQSEAAAETARALGADVVVADISDFEALQHVVRGADWVFHTAAIVAEDGRREDYERVNVQGTASVCEAVAEAGVQRLVHLSSVMVYGFDYPQDVTEDGPLNGQGNVYNESKIASEGIVLDSHGCKGLEVVVIRPGDVYGHGSQPWLERPLKLLRQGLFAIPTGEGVINHVHVDNLIDAVMLAFDNPGAAGGIFNITDGVATPCREFFRHHAAMVRRPLPRLPAPVLVGAVGAVEKLALFLGRSPPASRAGVHFLQRRNRYSIARARDLLGYSPRISLEEGMAALHRNMDSTQAG